MAKIEYKKLDNGDIEVKVEISEGTYIVKVITKDEAQHIYNGLRSVLMT